MENLLIIQNILARESRRAIEHFRFLDLLSEKGSSATDSVTDVTD
ncbi:hypothetical protein [Microcoleus sp. CAWBG58]|nr:hypothetical protein [Microcoleus sp. CAWBG58]